MKVSNSFLVSIFLFLILSCCDTKEEQSSEAEKSNELENSIGESPSDHTQVTIEESNSSEENHTDIENFKDTTFNGISIQQIVINEQPSLEKILVVELDKSYKPNIIGVTPNDPEGISLIEATNQYDICIGSGFVNSFSPLYPKGLLLIGNHIISRYDPYGYNSIITICDEEMDIVYHRNYSDSRVSYCQGAMQVGPLLVSNERKVNIVENNPKATRGFIGIHKNGNYIFGVSLNRVSLNDLASTLAQFCTQATNLSGGGAEGLTIKTENGIMQLGNVNLRQASFVTFGR